MALYDNATYDSDAVYDEDTASATPPTPMKKIKLGNLSKSKPAETAQFGDGVVESMTGNANFTTPDPTLATITGDAQNIRDKQAEIDACDAQANMLRGQLVALNETGKNNLRKLADYVEDKCDGNVDKLRSSGFSLVGDPTARGPLGQIQNLRVQSPDLEGQLVARYRSEPGAGAYIIEYSTSSEGPWIQATVTTRVSHTLTGLTPGTKYWIRVRAVGGTNGFGPWSDPACKMAA
jgi:Fibronectin type III domain